MSNGAESEIWKRLHEINGSLVELKVTLAVETAKLKEKIWIIQLIVYGFAGMILTGAAGALVSTVIQRAPIR